MLALSASTPFFAGRLAGSDCRWDAISKAVDDRNPAEAGTVPADSVEADDRLAGGGKRRLQKSRYSSVTTYIYKCPGNEAMVDRYNDVDCPVDEPTYDRLLGAGLDRVLAKHVAHLFTRDPLVIFEGQVEELDDRTSTNHFDNVQSTNWQTVRWKPPPPLPTKEAAAAAAAAGEAPPDHMGWRVEFRPMEVQLTDFENAAFVVFSTLATRVILAFDLNLYIPMSAVDENMRKAHLPDAVSEQTFAWRKLGDAGGSEEGEDAAAAAAAGRERDCCGGLRSESAQMTVDEIINGGGDNDNPGLIPLMRAYLVYISADASTSRRINAYLDLVSARASGELQTTAKYLRDFARAHPDYKHDSVVTERMAHDIAVMCADVGEGRLHAPELLGDWVVKPVEDEREFEAKLDGVRLSPEGKGAVLRIVKDAKDLRPTQKKPLSRMAGIPDWDDELFYI